MGSYLSASGRDQGKWQNMNKQLIAMTESDSSSLQAWVVVDFL